MAGPLEFKGDDGEDAHRFRRHSEKRRSIDAGRQLCQRNAPQARIFRTGPNSRLGCRRAFHRRGRQRICRSTHALRASHRSMRRQPPERRTRTTGWTGHVPAALQHEQSSQLPKVGRTHRDLGCHPVDDGIVRHHSDSSCHILLAGGNGSGDAAGALGFEWTTLRKRESHAERRQQHSNVLPSTAALQIRMSWTVGVLLFDAVADTVMVVDRSSCLHCCSWNQMVEEHSMG